MSALTAPPKVIYVAGLSHSGTTLLDLACSSGGGALSLGELQNALRGDFENIATRTCSCGETTSDCAFWSPLLDGLRYLDAPARLRLVMDRAFEYVGPGGVVIDSSKDIAGLKGLAPWQPLVIHTSKDVRAYIAARLKNARAKGRKVPRAIDEAISWWRQNNRVIAACEELGLRRIPVTYEALCLDTRSTVDRLNQEIGLPLLDAENLLGSQSHHALVGNRGFLRGAKTLRYDYAWMGQSDWLLSYMTLRPVRRANEARYPKQIIKPR